MKNTYLYGLSVHHSSHNAQSDAAECVRVRTDCAVVRPKAHWTRCQQIHDRTAPPLVLTKCKDNLRAAGASMGTGGEYGVQWLTGPLLCGTEEETSRKAECITLKDLSQRSDTSSDVRPFVSILGRIFNLIVPDLNFFSFRR